MLFLSSISEVVTSMCFLKYKTVVYPFSNLFSGGPCSSVELNLSLRGLRAGKLFCRLDYLSFSWITAHMHQIKSNIVSDSTRNYATSFRLILSLFPRTAKFQELQFSASLACHVLRLINQIKTI